MAENIGLQIAETLQTAHINHHPSAAHDANPSTTASKKSPVRLSSHSRRRRSSATAADATHTSAASDDEIPLDILEPQRRQTNLPPIPDLRFEQSYLARIKPYSDRGEYAWVAYYTLLDHVFMPLTQGLVLKLALMGWRRMNVGANFAGRGVGARVRRWWWGVNGWKMPEEAAVAEAKG